jgi:hypothetical protein
VTLTGRLFSSPAMAEMLNLSERRLHELVVAGILPRAGRGQYPLACVQAYIGFLMKTGARHAPKIAPERLAPFQRRAFYQGETARFAVERMHAELLPSSDVRRSFDIVIGLLKEELERMPERCADQLVTMSSPAEIRALVLAEARRSLVASAARIEAWVQQGLNA